MIFVIFFTPAIFLTSRILPEENAKIATFLVPWYDDLSFLSLKWELRMRILYLLAHLTVCHWFTWLNTSKNQKDTHIDVPKKHSQIKILPECWWFYTSAAMWQISCLTEVSVSRGKNLWAQKYNFFSLLLELWKVKLWQPGGLLSRDGQLEEWREVEGGELPRPS